jgi:hypothetical protein
LKNFSRRPIWWAAGFGLIFIATGLLAPGGLELQIAPVNGGPPLLVLALKPGERFTLHYYHSVENAPIWEEHSLDETGRIYIEEERYLKFGAGMGRMPGVGHMVQRGPYEAIENMHMPTGNFVLRIGSPGVDHRHEPVGRGAASGRALFGTTGQLAIRLVAAFFSASGCTGQLRLNIFD